MKEWSLPALLDGLHKEIHHRLEAARTVIAHPVSLGDASEEVWLALLRDYLPRRYEAAKAFVVDSEGSFSEQIDVVVFDRQYSPFIFKCQGSIFVPAESVYAVFEAKQTLNATLVSYAQRKIQSVRRLHRTSLPIPHAGGTYPAKALTPILGGVLTFESDWSPPMGDPMRRALEDADLEARLEIGCIAAHGYFAWSRALGSYEVHCGGKPATAFLLRLISELQFSGTVPMIDVDAYASWLSS